MKIKLNYYNSRTQASFVHQCFGYKECLCLQISIYSAPLPSIGRLHGGGRRRDDIIALKVARDGPWRRRGVSRSPCRRSPLEFPIVAKTGSLHLPPQPHHIMILTCMPQYVMRESAGTSTCFFGRRGANDANSRNDRPNTHSSPACSDSSQPFLPSRLLQINCSCNCASISACETTSSLPSVEKKGVLRLTNRSAVHSLLHCIAI
jgi:hypothetical protein